MEVANATGEISHQHYGPNQPNHPLTHQKTNQPPTENPNLSQPTDVFVYLLSFDQHRFSGWSGWVWVFSRVLKKNLGKKCTKKNAGKFVGDENRPQKQEENEENARSSLARPSVRLRSFAAAIVVVDFPAVLAVVFPFSPFPTTPQLPAAFSANAFGTHRLQFLYCAIYFVGTCPPKPPTPTPTNLRMCVC